MNVPLFHIHCALLLLLGHQFACGVSLQPTSGSVPSAVDGMDQNITLPDGSVRNVRDYLSEFVRDYKRVRTTHSRAQMRHVSTVGLLAGMIRIETLMQAALSNRTHRFQHEFDASTAEQVLEQLFQLEQQMLRDQKAVEFLGNALDVATNVRSYESFREDADSLLRDAVHSQLEVSRRRQQSSMRIGKALVAASVTADRSELPTNGSQINDTVRLVAGIEAKQRAELKRRMATVLDTVERHQRTIHGLVKRRVSETVSFLKRNMKQSSADESGLDLTTDRPYEQFSVGTSVLGQTLFSKLLGGGRSRRQAMDTNELNSIPDVEAITTERGISGSDDKSKQTQISDNTVTPARQEAEDEDSASVEEGPGGLVGLIASLSGGEEGSDIGALIGALTGVITNLLGPGGLDIESLIGTGTSLIAGLLGGDDNFGKVLGVYVGTALDGLSGGGGAANNGQFFGQFLGTVIAYLSADPDDDDLPLQPKLFLQNFFAGSKTTISKAGSAEADADTAATDMHPKPSGGGSDLFGFIGNIVGSIVAGVTSIIVNSSVGSSGGSSQGSADLLGGSSGASSAGSDAKPEHMHPMKT